MATRLADVGEFGLIGRIARLVEPLNRDATIAERLELSIGDDAAVWRSPASGYEALTTDALVEGVHFDLLTTNWVDLGWKSLAVNLSDVGAMGAKPELAVISLGLPRETVVEDIENFYRGMIDCARRWHVAIVGGDIVSSPVLTINVTALGSLGDRQLRRSAGAPGDILAITGWPGRSGGGLRLLQRGVPSTVVSGTIGELVQAHVRPMPRITEAACLVEAGITCAMDVSDGTRGDAAHICEQTDLAASLETERIPLHPALLGEFGREAALRLALDGGEDYELLCAGPLERIERAAALIAERTGNVLTPIGRLEARGTGTTLVSLIDSNGARVELPEESWDHFRHG